MSSELTILILENRVSSLEKAGRTQEAKKARDSIETLKFAQDLLYNHRVVVHLECENTRKANNSHSHPRPPKYPLKLKDSQGGSGKG